ncbi:MAG TPA: oleate hydratase [Candidatus Enterousia intestinigallinarum]|uniref:Oleate hydratase n=1 Tax=Candidatus Enterousia intestinigallinarum TaxID=2840790 RepID=A0A9D1FGE4_9PROT|nr:oleate hydratase [Candidatus Enterousia intestinigallinarum]
MAKAGKSSIKRRPATTNVYMIGSGIGSLAAAIYLIRDARVPGKNIKIFESLDVDGGSLDGAGDAKRGYMIRGGRMLNIPTYECLQDVMTEIPSIEFDDISLEEEFLEYNQEFKTHSRARLVDKNGGKVDVTQMGFSPDDRMDMEKLILMETEKSLGAKRIDEVFGPHFFKTNFWFMWQTTFAFQPWSSAAELRRYMIRFMHEFPRIHTLAGVARTAYNQHDSIVKPMVDWLRGQGVQIILGARVTDILFDQNKKGENLATKIEYVQRGKKHTINVAPTDIVTFTNGCMTDNSDEASTDTVAKYNTAQTAPSFELWKKIANGRPEFGDPDVFCSRPDESMWMSFTVTINNNPKLFEYIQRFTRNHPGGGALVTFKDSAWRLSFVVARQPHFKNQPMDTQIFWGYALNMFVDGDYVKKPMYKCTGREIMTELMGQLHIPKRDQAEMMRGVICRTSIMPYITSQFQPRKIGDRPLVIPQGYENFAFISQFAEVPDDVVFTMEYSVRAAQRAVYYLMGVDKDLTPISKHQYSPRTLLKSFLKLHS